jgi:hypothetical protein
MKVYINGAAIPPAEVTWETLCQSTTRVDHAADPHADFGADVYADADRSWNGYFADREIRKLDEPTAARSAANPLRIVSPLSMSDELPLPDPVPSTFEPPGINTAQRYFDVRAAFEKVSGD